MTMAMLDSRMFDPANFRSPVPQMGWLGQVQPSAGFPDMPPLDVSSVNRPPSGVPLAGPVGMPLDITPQAPQEQPGIFGALSNGLANNPQTLMALGAGIMQGGFGRGLQMAGPAMQADQKTRLQQGQLATTYKALIASGVPPQKALLAIYNPKIMESIATGMTPKVEKFGSGETVAVVTPGDGQVTPLVQGGPKFDDVSGLRKEFLAQPGVKKYQDAMGGYQSMLKSATMDSPASDLDMVYGLAKMLDPESVVREGEFETVRRSNSIPEQVKGYWQFLVEGKGKLTPGQREEIMTIARNRAESYRGQAQEETVRYRDLATKNKFDPEQVVKEFPETQRFVRAQQPSAALPRPKTIEETLKLPRGTRFIDPNGVERTR